MILRDTLFGVYVTEHIQLLLVASTHSYLLPACIVELRVVFRILLGASMQTSHWHLVRENSVAPAIMGLWLH